MVHEDSYLTPYDPESDAGVAEATALPADYPHLNALDFIPDSTDIPVPIREKEGAYTIGDAKHPSIIINKAYQPVDFDIETYGQNMELLAYAIGSAAKSSHQRAHVETIQFVAKASVTNNDRFFIDIVNGSGNIEHHMFYFDTDDSVSSAPTQTGINSSKAHEIDISGDTTATEVASSASTIIDGVTGLSTSVSTDTVTVTHDNAGGVKPAFEGSSNNCGLTFETTTHGTTNYSITEGLTYALDSFTLHVEQQHDGDEDIYYDLFGCVVDSAEITINFDDNIIKGKYSIKSPYAVTGNQNTKLPNRVKKENVFNWTHLEEAASDYLIMEGTTDRTPEIVNSLTLTINNNVEFQPNIGKDYMYMAIAGKRNVEFSITGYISNKNLFDFWKDIWSNANNYYSSASGRLNSKINIDRDASNDYIDISIYNLLITEHTCHLQSVEEQIKSVDLTFIDAIPDSNGYIFDSITMMVSLSIEQFHGD